MAKLIRVLDTKTKGSFDIREGEYQLKIAGDENSFDVTPAVRDHETRQETDRQSDQKRAGRSRLAT